MNQLIIDLKNKLNPMVELIKDKNDVFYLDYPLHLNVGDLLIYHGTEQFFKEHHINVTLKRCEYDLDLEEVKAKITPNTTPTFTKYETNSFWLNLIFLLIKYNR